ncbi:T-cell-interacting, activating receptor on myeloid cells protein 1-like [Carettochelys insculpta]|uniref:T-cell-interacting, activating receptor on myeloid cells protein 1-like n=1 Tax=Carettochelys insculpta TaxID=44489 RepID=UPI003EBAA2BC
MASALALLCVSFWLAGHCQSWGGREFAKPLIWVRPSRVVALGESVTIHCQSQHYRCEFYLRKAGNTTPRVQEAPHGNVAEFPFPSVGRADGGSYTCDYHPITEWNRWSHLSDPIEIIVADPSLPRPSVSLSPSRVTAPGADVTIQCQGPQWEVNFFLHKAGDPTPQRITDRPGDKAEFHIRPVGRQHGGSYSCTYRPRVEPFLTSLPSNPVELVVRAVPTARPDFTHTNIARLVLSAGVLLILGLILAEAYCSCLRGAAWSWALGAGGSTEGPQHCPVMASALALLCVSFWLAGHCQSWGGREFAKPLIWVRPSRVVALGESVTIQCQSQHYGCEFYLHKAGNTTRRVQEAPHGNVAEFPFPSVGRADGGSYTCEYCPITDPTRWSHLSDPIEIIVAERTDPTQPGAALAPTHLSSARPERSGPQTLPGLSSPLITGVSVVAATVLLLLLLVASICVIVRTRATQPLHNEGTWMYHVSRQ